MLENGRLPGNSRRRQNYGQRALIGHKLPVQLITTRLELTFLNDCR